MDSVEVVRELGERWNAGDMAGVIALYADDVVMRPSADWLDTQPVEGKERFRETAEEWRGMWKDIEIETDRIEPYGDRVVVHGCWNSTGRGGVVAALPVHMVFTVRDGRITRLEWFPDDHSARDAARAGA